MVVEKKFIKIKLTHLFPYYYLKVIVQAYATV